MNSSGTTVQRSSSLDPVAASVEGVVVKEEQVLGQFIPLLYHYNMLQDEDRVNAFRAAIEMNVRPGMHVLELGGGTGILSSFAARCGATVTCVERNPELVDCALELIERNGLSEQISVVQADAATYVPSSPVDVVVCEMLHVGLLREKQAQVIDAFKSGYRRIYGKRMPLFLPEVSILMVQPVQHSFEFAGYIAPLPMFQAPLVSQPRTCELSNLAAYANIDYQHKIPMEFEFSQEFIAHTSGEVNALRFITQNVITVSEAEQKAITWPNQCLVLPIAEPFLVEHGHAIEVAFKYPAGGSIQHLSDSIELAHRTH